MVKKFTRRYLFVSLIPVALFFALTFTGAFFAQKYIAGLLQQSTHELNTDAQQQLEKLGQEFIQAQAKKVAGQVEMFLKFHPEMASEALPASAYLKKVAMQKVGQTGYTCLYEANSGIMRIHPNPDLVNRKMNFLSEKLPSFWAVFKRSLSGVEVSGYYNWIEPDGSIRKKYMATTPAGKTLQGRTIMVAATTYIDEFSAPIVKMGQKAQATITGFQTFIASQTLIVVSIMALLFLLTFTCVYLIGRRSALDYMQPIVTMANAAANFSYGDWNIDNDAGVLKREDEIGALARSFVSMQLQLKKIFGDLENRISELKATQNALKKSEAHYRGLFNGVPIGLYRTTVDNRIIDSNPTLVKMLGYPSKEKLLSVKASDLYFNPDDRSDWQIKMGESDTEVISEIKMRCRDKAVIWVENHSRVEKDENNQVLYFEGSLMDITERKNTELALHESEKQYRRLYEETKRSQELYRSLLHSSADAIIICDLGQRVTYVSPVFTELFGWSLDEVEGKKISYVPESEKEKSKFRIEEVINNGTICHGYETIRNDREGRQIKVSISISRFEDHNGQPAGILSILRDITERKEIEAQLLFAQRMEAIGTLAGGLAHDFNNLMMGILGNTSIMINGMDSSDPKYQKLQNIEKLVQSGSKLTSQLLGYARKGKLEHKTADLNLIVKESAAIFGRTRKEIVFHMDLSTRRMLITVDKSQIEQVLFNLFINAADAMPNGGDLFLKTSIAKSSDLNNRPYTPAPGDYVMLQVKDTGKGMSPETQKQVFDPFFTTKEMGRGTGLGLASAYGIVKAHAGYIEVASKINKGTVFTIFLKTSEQQLLKPKATKPVVETGQGTILFVDDEDMIREIGSEMVEQMGYTVIPAEDGNEAISLFSDNPDGIDLVILDLIMPGVSGSQTFDRLKKINPEIKVLLSSGYSMDSQAMALMDSGCNGFIQKPYNIAHLSKKISRVLSS